MKHDRIIQRIYSYFLFEKAWTHVCTNVQEHKCTELHICVRIVHIFPKICKEFHGLLDQKRFNICVHWPNTRHKDINFLFENRPEPFGSATKNLASLSFCFLSILFSLWILTCWAVRIQRGEVIHLDSIALN